MNTAPAVASRIVYRVRLKGTWLGDANDRDEAEELIYIHANRNQRPVSDYRILPELREEAT